MSKFNFDSPVFTQEELMVLHEAMVFYRFQKLNAREAPLEELSFAQQVHLHVQVQAGIFP